MNENKDYDITLKHPSRFIIYGPSGSGKSTFVEKILLYMNSLFGFDFDNIIYCSGQVFPNFDYINNKKVKKLVTIDKDLLLSIDKNRKNIIIIDDNMHQMTNDILISDLFTKISHHQNITVILILQNLFPKSKYMRDISSNSTYIVLMSNPRETLQIKTLSTQIDGANQNFIINCYKDATKNKPFSYLFLDFDQNTPEELRVRTNIFPDETPKYVYVKIPQVL
jgi:energy-coupling factor transporter ATP-binding protein EcfA2